MVESLPVVVTGRWRQGARFVLRTARRALVESLYLLTAPVIAAVGLLLVLGGLWLDAAPAVVVLPVALVAAVTAEAAALRRLERDIHDGPSSGWSTWRWSWAGPSV